MGRHMTAAFGKSWIQTGLGWGSERERVHWFFVREIGHVQGVQLASPSPKTLKTWGFEEAMRMLFASYNSSSMESTPCYHSEVSHPAMTPMAPMLPPNDDETDCEGSDSGTPRGRSLFSPKSLGQRDIQKLRHMVHTLSSFCIPDTS